MFVAMFVHDGCAPELIGVRNTRVEAESLVCGYLVRSGALFAGARDELRHISDPDTVIVDPPEVTTFLSAYINQYHERANMFLTEGGFFNWLAWQIEQFPEMGISLEHLEPFIDNRDGAPKYSIEETPPPPPYLRPIDF